MDDRPLPGEKDAPVVAFRSPPDLRVELSRPNLGPISGMGIRPGVTLIVGGGFHGKSTLLRALERGIYNHIPGDGREWVVTQETAVKVRAEDGRYVEKVDLSPFINDLPLGKPTHSFSTENASGSTTHAATNHEEYFAELPEAYFGHTDWFPHNREELRKYDPRGFRMIEEVWSAEAFK